MMAKPGHNPFALLLPAQGRRVKVIVRVEEDIQTALVRGVRVKNAVVIAQEDAQPRQLTLLGPELTGLDKRRRRLVIVLDGPLSFIQRHPKVIVEVAAEG